MAIPVPQLQFPQWGQALGAGLAQGLNRRWDRQEQQEQQNRLAQMLPGAMQGDQQALNALAQISPDAYLKVLGLNQQREAQTYERGQADAQQQREALKASLSEVAGAIVNTPEAQLPQVWAQLRGAALQRNPALAQYLPEAYGPEILPTAKSIYGIKPMTAQARGPNVISAGGILADDAGNVLVSNPARPAGNQFFVTPEGIVGVNKTSMAAQPVTMNGAPVVPLAADVTAQGNIATAKARGSEIGEAQGAIVAKQPVLASYQSALGAMRAQIPKVSTGGPLGAKGYAARILDTQGVNEFESLKEQLSTEMRSIFRIPGEGALSDKEQAQYGLQLPSVRNDPAVNGRLLDALDARVQARLGSGGTDAPAAPDNAGKVIDWNELP